MSRAPAATPRWIAFAPEAHPAWGTLAVMGDVVLELAALAYEAGAEPSRWPAFLARIADELGDRTAALQIHDLGNARGSMAFSHRVDPADEAAYATRYAAMNPWIAGGGDAIQQGKVLFGEDAISTRALVRTEFYADFLRPQGIRHSLAAVVARDRESIVLVTIQRSARRGSWTRREAELVEALMPHLARAFEMHRRLGALRMRERSLAETAEHLSWGVVLVDRADRIVFANGVARRLDRTTMGRVRAAIASGGGCVRRPERYPLAVRVAPLMVRDDVLASEPALRAAFILDPEQRGELPEALLRELYDLTGAEARLAIALARGNTLHEIAAATGAQMSTLRTHLKRVFAKTHTHRQAELVRLVLY